MALKIGKKEKEEKKGKDKTKKKFDAKAFVEAGAKKGIKVFTVAELKASKNKYSINITPNIHNAIIRRDVSIPSSNNRDLNSSEYPAMKNKATNI